FNFFVVAVPKHEHSGWKLGRRRTCSRGIRLGRRDQGHRLTEIRNPHPLTTLVLQHQRFYWTRCGGRCWRGLHRDYLRWRSLRFALLVFFVIVIRIVRWIKVWRIGVRIKQRPREELAAIETTETDSCTWETGSRTKPRRNACVTKCSGYAHAAHLRWGF